MIKKFGVSYNVFDGEELLEKSILSVRESVDFISVVYQLVSNFGNPADGNLYSTLLELRNKGLVDKLIEFNPKTYISPHINEVTKRNIGFFASKEAGCNYHMSMDTDEFYRKDQLENIKNIYIEESLEAGFAQMQTYYKFPTTVLDPPEDYYVSLFYKIKKDNNYYLGCQTPVLVDPTRRINSNFHRVFTRDEIEMHHMSYVRDNIINKFSNSSAKQNFRNIEEVINHFNNFNGVGQALMMGADNKLYDTRVVDNLFNV